MLNLLDNILGISQKISNCMQENNWSDVETLQDQQKALLNQLDQTATPTDSEAQKKASELSTQIQRLTAEQIQLSKANKQKLYGEIKNNNKSKKMNKAYGLQTK